MFAQTGGKKIYVNDSDVNDSQVSYHMLEVCLSQYNGRIGILYLNEDDLRDLLKGEFFRGQNILFFQKDRISEWIFGDDTNVCRAVGNCERTVVSCNSVEDTIHFFMNHDISVLVMGNFAVLKNYHVGQQIVDFAIEFRRDGRRVSSPGETLLANDATEMISRESTMPIMFFRKYFALNHVYYEWLLSGKKSTTIRYKSGAVEFPLSNRLNLWKSEDFKPYNFNRTDTDRNSPCASILIHKIDYVRFGELLEDDAIHDGFHNLDEMRRSFRDLMYPSIQDKSWVTLYHISII